MCARTDMSVIIFVDVDGTLRVVGHRTSGGNAVQFIKLTGNRFGRTRSHFERLVAVMTEEEDREAKKKSEKAAEKAVAMEAEREKKKAAEEARAKKEAAQKAADEAASKKAMEDRDRQAAPQAVMTEEEEREAKKKSGKAAEKSVAMEAEREKMKTAEEARSKKEAAQKAADEAASKKAMEDRDGQAAPQAAVERPAAATEEQEVAEEVTARRAEAKAEATAERWREEWASMFAVTVDTQQPRTTREDLLHEVAAQLAKSLRDRPTMPMDPVDATKAWSDVASGVRLPPVSCAFKGCTWCSASVPPLETMVQDDPEHPFEQLLREHVCREHGPEIQRCIPPELQEESLLAWAWDLYKLAIAGIERSQVPVVGASVDRRTQDHLAQVYNDVKIRSLICFCCAQVKPDTGRCRSQIGFRNGRWLFGVSTSCLRRNFLMSEYEKEYRKSGTPLAIIGNNRSHDTPSPDFSDWTIMIDREAVLDYLQKRDPHADTAAVGKQKRRQVNGEQLLSLCGQPLLCCPEDVFCPRAAHLSGTLCGECTFPICRRCQLHLQAGENIPEGLGNDNWYGYLQRWICEAQVL